MTRILTIIALLFATPAWAYEINEKAFLCKSSKEPSANGARIVSASIFAVHFKDGLANQFDQNTLRSLSHKYQIDAEFVSWSDGQSTYQLQPKTLRLKRFYNILTDTLAFAEMRDCEEIEETKLRQIVSALKKLGAIKNY